MTVTQKAQTVAKDIAATPSAVLVTTIDEVKAALDSLRDVVNSGEASADAVLDSLASVPPHLFQPILDLLHLSKGTK